MVKAKKTGKIEVERMYANLPKCPHKDGESCRITLTSCDFEYAICPRE